MLSILPKISHWNYLPSLSEIVEQSSFGFILLASKETHLVTNDDNVTYYESLGIKTDPNTYAPLVIYQELNGLHLIHVYCPNTTKLWHVRKLFNDDSNHPPTLCPNKWIEGQLKVPNWQL